MNVFGVRNNLSKPKPETFTEMFHFKDLGKAVSDADYVVSALPFTALTTNLISKEIFQQFKKGSVFSNVGRGDSVDDEALRQAIHAGIVRGAGLDVVKGEPLNSDHWIYQDKEIQDRVLLTCHKVDMGQFQDDLSLKIFEDKLKLYVKGANFKH